MLPTSHGPSESEVEWICDGGARCFLRRVDVLSIEFCKRNTSSVFFTHEDAFDVADSISVDVSGHFHLPFTPITCKELNTPKANGVRYAAMNTRRFLAILKRYADLRKAAGEAEVPATVDVLVPVDEDDKFGTSFPSVRVKETGSLYGANRDTLAPSKFSDIKSYSVSASMRGQCKNFVISRWLTAILLHRAFRKTTTAVTSVNTIDLDGETGAINSYVRLLDDCRPCVLYLRENTQVTIDGHAAEPVPIDGPTPEGCVTADIISLFLTEAQRNLLTRDSLYYAIASKMEVELGDVDYSLFNHKWVIRHMKTFGNPVTWLCGKFNELGTSYDASITLGREVFRSLKMAEQLPRHTIKGVCVPNPDVGHLMNKLWTLFNEHREKVDVGTYNLTGYWQEYYDVVVKSFLCFSDDVESPNALGALSSLICCIGSVFEDTKQRVDGNMRLLAEALFGGECTVSDECPKLKQRAFELAVYRTAGEHVMTLCINYLVSIRPSLATKWKADLRQYFTIM